MRFIFLDLLFFIYERSMGKWTQLLKKSKEPSCSS